MTDNDDDTLRVEARFKNARLFNAIRSRALPPQSKSAAGASHQVDAIKPWCEANDLPVGPVYDLLNLRRGPISRTQKGGKLRVRDICVRLAALLDCDVRWLFPADLYAVEWPRLAVEMSPGAMPGLSPRLLALPPSQDDGVLQRELRARIMVALSTLTPRQAKVIRERFGLDDYEHTLEEIGAGFGVSRERARQIEAKALRRLRHPKRSGPLRTFIESINDGDDAKVPAVGEIIK